MITHGYTTLIRYEPGETPYDYMAYCAELPGVMTDGRTAKEAQANIDELIPFFLEVMQDIGESMPSPRPLNQLRGIRNDEYGLPVFEWEQA